MSLFNRKESPEDIARHRIKNAKVNGSTRLDLSNLGLTSLPPELGQLIASTQAELSGWDEGTQAIVTDLQCGAKQEACSTGNLVRGWLFSCPQIRLLV